MLILHDLKTWPRHFEAIWLGSKHFELRFNDRYFKVGDELLLREWIPDLDYNTTKSGNYSGRGLSCKITYILSDSEDQPEFVPDGWVILSIVVTHHYSDKWAIK